MKIEKVTRSNVVDTVFEQMKQMILSGQWKSGERIAGENELSRQFGVSRVSVREAIHRLLGMGVLTARHGDGTYVADPVGGQMQSRLMQQMLLSRPQLLEVLQFRLMVEVGCAGLAAQAADAEGIEHLRRLETEMNKADCSIADFARMDLAYHNAVVMLSGNRLVAKVTAVIQDVYADAMEETILLRGIEVGRGNHRPITDAIEAHDVARAEALMREHIQSVIELLEPHENPS